MVNNLQKIMFSNYLAEMQCSQCKKMWLIFHDFHSMALELRKQHTHTEKVYEKLRASVVGIGRVEYK